MRFNKSERDKIIKLHLAPAQNNRCGGSICIACEQARADQSAGKAG